MNGCELCMLAADALMLKHRAISIRSADKSIRGIDTIS